MVDPCTWDLVTYVCIILLRFNETVFRYRCDRAPITVPYPLKGSSIVILPSAASQTPEYRSADPSDLISIPEVKVQLRRRLSFGAETG